MKEDKGVWGWKLQSGSDKQIIGAYSHFTYLIKLILNLYKLLKTSFSSVAETNRLAYRQQ